MSVSGIPSTGALIFISIKPLIRIVIPGGVGFILTKKNIFPATGPRIASSLILNCTLPALLFSKIVPSFSSSNISSLSSLLLTGFFYQGVNFCSGILVRSLCQTPRQFRYGFLSAFTYSNWGDLPTAVLQSVTSASPFNGTEDENTAIAYIAIFILVAYISQFPLGGMKLIRMDYTSPIDPEVERRCEEGVWWRKVANRLRRGKPMAWEMAEFAEREKIGGQDPSPGVGDDEKEKGEQGSGLDYRTPSNRSHATVSEEIAEIRAFNTQLRPTGSRTAPTDGEPFPCTSPTPSLAPLPSSHSNHPSAVMRVLYSILSFLRSLVSPPTMSLLSALIIAVVPTLKALFIAPILYDTATFVGAASVPLGLLVLGASIGRMTIPRPISKLPLVSIASMAVVRMALLPLIGYLFVRMLVERTGMVAADNKVLRFVLIYMSCVPTATTQVAYTQIFAPEGAENNADLLAAYLIAQYCVFAFSSVVLTALTLNNIF